MTAKLTAFPLIAIVFLAAYSLLTPVVHAPPPSWNTSMEDYSGAVYWPATKYKPKDLSYGTGTTPYITGWGGTEPYQFENIPAPADLPSLPRTLHAETTHALEAWNAVTIANYMGNCPDQVKFM